MTLPLSHQNGTSVCHALNISNNKIEKSLKNAGSPPVVNILSLEAQQRFKAAFNIGTSAKLIINTGLKVMEVNEPFKVWLGTALAYPIKGTALDELNLFKKPTIKELQKRISAPDLKKSNAFIADLKVNGTYHQVQIFISSISLNGNNLAEQFLIDLTDMTELEQNKTGWSESRLMLRKQDAEFRKVARVISHDLRGPAINMSNLVGLLESTENSLIEPELLAGLKTSVNSILTSLSDVGLELNTSWQQHSGNPEVTIESRVERVLNDIEQESCARHAQINFKAYDGSDWGIPQELLKMVLTQLISNSIKFCSKERGLVVNITAFKQDGNRMIRVSDNGVGIDLKGQEQRLFGLFQTFHVHPEARGVGLFQVKNRMKSIGGDVLLESEVGVGTTVSLNFN